MNLFELVAGDIWAAVFAEGARCACCDLPRYSCGKAAIKKLRTEDPEFASFVETPEGARI